MTTETEQSEMNQVAALPGWHTMDKEKPHLLGTRCTACGTYYFPKQSLFCKNPHCDSEEFEEVPLSRTGKVWSFTNACYKPPPPFVAQEPFEPYTLAAVELAEEKMIVLGQVATGVNVTDLSAGMEMELILDTLFIEEDSTGAKVEKLSWKWSPVSK